MHKRSTSKTTLLLIDLILFFSCICTLHVAQEVGREETGARSTSQLQYQDRKQTVQMPFALPLQDSLPLRDSLRSQSLGTSLAVTEGDMEWSRAYGGTLGDFVHAVIQTTDGGYALAGRTRTSETDGYCQEFWLVKTDAAGYEQWTQTYAGSEVVDRAEAVIQTADGGFAITGSINGSEWTKIAAWLVKTDANGVPQWNRTYSGSDTDAAHAVIQTADGGFALVGWTRSYGGGDADFWLVKTDASGVVEWNQTYGGANPDYAYTGIQTADGGYALAGSVGVPQNRGWDDAWLVKTYPNGTVQWNQTYGDSGGDNVYAVIETTDGGFALAGDTDSYGTAMHSFWLVKTDANGDHQWSKTYGGSQYDTAYAVIEMADRGFALAGYTKSFGVGSSDGWLVKTDAHGDVEWTQTYGGAEDNYVYAGIQTVDGGFALAGFTESSEGGDRDGWLVKTIPPETTQPTVTLTSPQNTTYATNMIPVYATNTTKPIHSAWWRYWNGSWSANQTLIWNEAEGWWEAEGLTWLDGNYQIQVFFNDSLGNVAIESKWFTVDTTSPDFTPAVTVVSPNGGEYWNGTQTINWTAKDPQDNPLTYTVYYSPNGGQIWTQLAVGLTESPYLWDTTAIENGANCLIQVEASNGIHTGADVSDASFNIANEPINIAPVVYVIQPNGGERINGTSEIQWSANDPNGDVLTFNISYSPNGGDTWTQLATGVTEPSYSWDTTTVVNGTSYLIQVEASDGMYTEVDVSDKPFEIANELIPFATQPVKTKSSMAVAVAAAAISGVVLVGAAAKAASIPPPLPGMRFRKDFINRLIWYLLYPFIWLFGHIVYPPVCRRLNKADVTMNSTRQAILQLLEERGVAYLREIERTIDSGFFGLMWHLQVLEDFDYIRQMRIGKYRVYYLKGYGSSVPPSVELRFLFKNKNTRAIINYINDNPGTYQAEIARAVDLHHTTVRYYLLQMKKQKLFESFSDGRRIRYFLLDEKRPQVDKILQHVLPEGA